MVKTRLDFPADVQVENLTTNHAPYIGGMLFRPGDTRTVKVRALWVWTELKANTHLRVTYLGASAFAGDAGPDHNSALVGGSDHDRAKKASARRRQKSKA